jgi:gluconate 2-dehydrogenase gamma chain
MGVAAALPASAFMAAVDSPLAPRRAESARHDYFFFDADEARFIEAACERLLPEEPSLPGALAAGVPRYLDHHLAGAWGVGEVAYRHGPWQPGTPTHAEFPKLAPAVLFRRALSGIHRDLNDRSAPGSAPGFSFEAWPARRQDAYLGLLADGGLDLDGVPSKVFFQLLLAMTVEGFFSHPRFGSTRDRVAWPMRGFPGAHAAVS